MKIIYHCYGGTHSSVVASSIHLGTLPQTELPSQQELLDVNLFDDPKQIIHGKLHFMGTDEYNHEIYSCGMRNGADIVKSSIKDILHIYQIDPDEQLKFVDTLSCVNIYMRIGGFLSQVLGLSQIGRPLVLNGTLKAYFDIADVVQQVKAEL